MFATTVRNCYKIVAGPGAGVEVTIECDVNWSRNQDGDINFEPTEADVTFKDYHNTRSADKGLKIELESIEASDADNYEGGDDDGTLRITHQNTLYTEDHKRQLVLSAGYQRCSYKAGEGFSFSVEVDHMMYNGYATFLEEGEIAWENLLVSDDEEE